MFSDLRAWVDGEMTLREFLQGVSKKITPGQATELLLGAIAREISLVMENEMVCLPKNQHTVPHEYYIYLSRNIAKQLLGEKRQITQSWLPAEVFRRFKELNKGRDSTVELKLEFGVDPTLKEGQFRVRHLWDESSSGTQQSMNTALRLSLKVGESQKDNEVKKLKLAQ